MGTSSSVPSPAASVTEGVQESRGLNGGGYAGVVLGALCALFLGLGLGYFMRRRRQSKGAQLSLGSGELVKQTPYYQGPVELSTRHYKPELS